MLPGLFGVLGSLLFVCIIELDFQFIELLGLFGSDYFLLEVVAFDLRQLLHSLVLDGADSVIHCLLSPLYVGHLLVCIAEAFNVKVACASVARHHRLLKGPLIQ